MGGVYLRGRHVNDGILCSGRVQVLIDLKVLIDVWNLNHFIKVESQDAMLLGNELIQCGGMFKRLIDQLVITYLL